MRLTRITKTGRHARQAKSDMERTNRRPKAILPIWRDAYSGEHTLRAGPKKKRKLSAPPQITNERTDAPGAPSFNQAYLPIAPYGGDADTRPFVSYTEEGC